MPAEGGGAAGLDGGHHLQLWQVQMSGVLTAVGRTMSAEDFRDLQSGAGHETGISRNRPPVLPADQAGWSHP